MSMDCSLPSFSVHGDSPGRSTLEYFRVAMPISRGSSGPRDQTSILNDYPHWQVGSLPLAPPGKPLGSCQSVRSVAQLCPTLGDPMNCSIPGFPMCHPLPEPAQTHVHQVGDAIQPSLPLLSPSPPAFRLS